MPGILTWMDNSALSRMILEAAWAFPALETLHFFGLILLIGSIYVVDLRFLGLAKEVPLQAVMRFVPVAAAGFAINLITGIGFLFADPFRYYPNLSFRLKMLLVLLAGLNALWFKYAVHAGLARGDRDPDAIARLIAAISIILWSAVIVLGRLIPYLE
jgi:hypothetical protein